MKRLPFKLTEYAPVINYSSATAKEVWAPRIQRVSTAWIQTERDSVASGIRPSALQHVSPEQLPELLRNEALRGLVVLPLAQVPKTQGYQSASVPLQPGAPFDYKAAVTRPEHAAAWADAWSRSDDDAIGRLLGTPACCRAAFQRYWKEEKWIDLTWPTTGQGDSHVFKSAGYNGLLRWLGVRGVSHLPCSPTCTETLTLSERMIACMSERFPEEAQWLRELLSFPTLWTSLHGVAEITNPILRMSVASDALAQKAEVHYLGQAYPDEGVAGIAFPHRKGDFAKKAITLLRGRPSDPAANGFSSREAMQAAHDRLLALVTGRTFGTVLDLGCGDGELLTRIPAKRRVGVESDPARAKKAAPRVDSVVEGNCSDPAILQRLLSEETPDLVIAQRDRNPLETLLGFTTVSYSYEQGAAEPILLDPASVV